MLETGNLASLLVFSDIIDLTDYRKRGKIRLEALVDIVVYPLMDISAMVKNA